MKGKYHHWIVPLLILQLAWILPPAAGKIPGYDLSRPDKKYTLPGVLHEVSGITGINSSALACVQDENGILFIYDLQNNRISEEIFFGYNGDYEGIARVGSTIYVLRSDGVLYEVPEFAAKTKTTLWHDTQIPAQNNEGLCYDAANNRLLIGCKGKPSGEPEDKYRRLIYAFDLAGKKLQPKPVYEFDVRSITRFAVKNKVIPAYRTNKKGKSVAVTLKLATSEIAIHPQSGLLYLLSASDHMLMVFEPDGNIRHILALNPILFNKAEGITFLDNGDMLITNEGQDRHPTLLRFNFKP